MQNTFGRNDEVTDIIGSHDFSRFNYQVDVFHVKTVSDTEYLPVNLCSLFTNLIEYECYGRKIREISRDNFRECRKLSDLQIENSQFTEIPFDVLYDLKNLKKLEISSTYLMKLPAKLFDNNQKLESIKLMKNKLIFISSIFPPSIKFLSLMSNECINKNYTQVEVEIYQNCSESNLETNKIKILESQLASVMNAIENGTKITNLIGGEVMGFEYNYTAMLTSINAHNSKIDKLEEVVEQLQSEDETHRKRFEWNEVIQYVSCTMVLISVTFFIFAFITMRNRRLSNNSLPLMENYAQNDY
jgi:hypothetical protein